MSVIAGILALSQEGVQQGDAAGPAGFCKALQKHAKWALEQLLPVEGFAIFDMDDGYMAGPIEELMEVVAGFQERLTIHVGATLNLRKCKLWCAKNLRGHVRQHLRSIGNDVFDLAFVKLKSGHKAYGVMVSGVPMGDKAFVHNKMKVKVETVVRQIEKTCNRLQLVSAQNLYALLVQCMNCKLQFWMQCMPPHQIRDHLRVFDNAMILAVRKATGQALSRDGSLPIRRLRWPRRLCGGMIRSAVDVAPTAYVGGMCLCVPSFTASVDEDGHSTPGCLDHMPDDYGVGSFDHGKEDTRFEVLLTGDSTLGKDLLRYFTKMKSEVHAQASYDDLSDSSVFKAQPKGAGLCRNKLIAKPQHELTLAREQKRHDDTLRRLAHKTRNRGVNPTRQEAALLSANRLSSQFVGVPAMERTVIGNVLYHETWAAYLGTDSPICAPWVGTKFSCGKRSFQIDRYGDVVCSAPIDKGQWTVRHDQFKWTLARQCQWSQYDMGVEVAHLFLPVINQKQQFLNRVKQRQRQGLVPDLIDVKRQRLMDVKTMSFNPSRYGPARFRHGKRSGGVQFRADAVNTKCIQKAKDVDTNYNGVDFDTEGPGPVLKRLQTYGRVEGLVVGAHGEASPELDSLIKRVADKGALARYRVLGFACPLAARSTVLNQIYLTLGVEAIRGVARLRVSNLSTALTGSRSRKAAKARRRAAKSLFEEQNLAYWHRHCYFDL